mmetsp:Transcript_9812/g.25778  ORF Transcript_9812/g.25778 Transcript_9812/m.25778 type:complete len:310 (+) Transcript_9812:980-1909(+)
MLSVGPRLNEAPELLQLRPVRVWVGRSQPAMGDRDYLVAPLQLVAMHQILDPPSGFGRQFLAAGKPPALLGNLGDPGTFDEHSVAAFQDGSDRAQLRVILAARRNYVALQVEGWLHFLAFARRRVAKALPRTQVAEGPLSKPEGFPPLAWRTFTACTGRRRHRQAATGGGGDEAVGALPPGRHAVWLKLQNGRPEGSVLENHVRGRVDGRAGSRPIAMMAVDGAVQRWEGAGSPHGGHRLRQREPPRRRRHRRPKRAAKAAGTEWRVLAKGEVLRRRKSLLAALVQLSHARRLGSARTPGPRSIGADLQ